MTQNCYDERYDIRLARKDDIDAIMSFIEHHWKAGHIMATNRELFEYEFLEADGTVNFVLAVDRNKCTIESMTGFIKSSHNAEHLDIWGSFWKTLDGNITMLGTELLKRRPALIGSRCCLGVGSNPNTSVLLHKYILKQYTAKMKHYYMLSERALSDFKIAKIEHKVHAVCGDAKYNVVRFESIDQIKKRFDITKYVNCIPYKDYWYINHRFFDYPIHKYEVYGVEKEGDVNAIVVLRRQLQNGRVAIRFVDYIGDQKLIEGIGWFFKEILNSGGDSEYADFYCSGFDCSAIEKAGFTLLEDTDTNVIPNYFGPFVQKNVDIWVAFPIAGPSFTKSDGDQDRPSACASQNGGGE